jgi:hypothetical protein
MLNTYELKLPSLSADLTNKLFEAALTYDFLKEGTPNPIIFRGLKDIDVVKAKNYHDVTKQSPATYKTFGIRKELRDEIVHEMTDILFPFSQTELYFQRIEGGETISPHRDAIRPSHILCNISDDNATTNFHNKLIDDKDRMAFDIDEVSEPIETHILNPFKWYLFNSQKVHSVTNITKTRVAVCVDIPYAYENVYKHFVDKNII